MTVLVVDRLQAIEIDQHQRQPRSPASLAACLGQLRQQLRHFLDERASIAQTSERVRHTGLLQTAIDSLQLRVTCRQLAGARVDLLFEAPAVARLAQERAAVPLPAERDDRKQHERITEIRPARQPGRRIHVERQIEAALAPYTVGVRGPHMQGVAATGKIRVGHGAAGAGVLPVAVETVQLESELVGVGSREIERCDFETHDVTVMQVRHEETGRERQRFARFERGRQHHRRRSDIKHDTVGVERVVAVGAAEIQAPAAARVVRPEVEFFLLQAVHPVEAADLARDRIEAGQPVVGAEPESGRGIRVNTVDGVVRQPVAVIEMVETDRLGDERAAHDTIETATASPHPHRTFGVDVDRVDGRTAQRAGLVRVVLQMEEAAADRIENIQSTSLRAYPEAPGPVLGERGNPLGRKALGVRGIGKVALESTRGALEPGQSASIGSHPEPAGRIFQQRHDTGRAETAGIVRIVREHRHRQSAGCDPIETPIHGARPDDAFVIRQQGHYPVVAQSSSRRSGLAQCDGTRRMGVRLWAGGGARARRTHDRDSAAECRDPQPAGSVLGEPVDTLARHALLGTRAMRPERPGARIPTGHTPKPGTDPQESGPICVQRENVIVRKAGGIRGIFPVVVESSAVPIEQRQAISRTDPEALPVVYVESTHLVGGKTARVTDVMAKHGLHAAHRVELPQSGVSSDPELAAGVFQESANVHCMASGQRDVFEFAARAIEPVQPCQRAHPDGTAPVLEQCEHGVVTEAACIRRTMP